LDALGCLTLQIAAFVLSVWIAGAAGQPRRERG
jgi:hypothetical protein